MATLPRRQKTKIRPPRKQGVDTSIQETWAKLKDAIHEIHSGNAASLSFEACYRYAYNMVLNKQGRQLYDGTKELVSEHIDKLAETQVMPAFPYSSTSGDVDPAQKSQEVDRFLKAIRDSWDSHISSMSKLRDILKYMDRSYTIAEELPPIYDAGIALYLRQMIRPPIKEYMIEAILDQIRIDRLGFAINRSTLRNCTDVLTTLQYSTEKGFVSVYRKDVEPAILRESRAFYKAEGEKLIMTCNAPDYLRRTDERFVQEKERSIHYLSRYTGQKLREILQETMLAPVLSTIINKRDSGLDDMINCDRSDDLSRLYRLFIEVPTGLQTLKDALKASILRRGIEINQTCEMEAASIPQDVSIGSEDRKGKGKAKPSVTSAEVASAWVEDILGLKDVFDLNWKRCFDSNREIETACNEAFARFINQNKQSPEFISLYIDENLKKGLKGKTDQEIDSVLDKTITIFRYIGDKDVFERYYKSHLSKRLLQNRSVSEDAERGMLAKLKVECGFHFTQKLEGMFTDMKVSADTTEAFRRHIAERNLLSEVEMSVTIMTSNSWPNNITQAPPTCHLPEIMSKCTKAFEMFYLSRHQGRKLTWQLGLGNIDLKVAFKKRRHDVNVSSLALVILLLFEGLDDGEFLTYEEIRSSTQLDDTNLKRQLQSLACAKFKILKKHPPSRDVHEDESFSFNSDFTSPMQRIKISTISAQTTKIENEEERKETQTRVNEERKVEIDACIVRIMKNRKHMTHNDLVNEATRQLSSRFRPQPIDIKKRIEHLIETDFLERCEDRKSYNYLA